MGADLSAAFLPEHIVKGGSRQYENRLEKKADKPETVLVTGLILAFGGGQSDAQTVSGCIMSLGSVVAYIVGEGLVDRSHAGDNSTGGMEDDEDG